VKPGKKLLELCADLHQDGYILALDDYIHQKVWAHFYPYIKIIKIDWQETELKTIHEIKDAIKNHPHISLLLRKLKPIKSITKQLN
jgi:EAL and modified HD-GYP domain-containing signal transduction protein